MTSAAAPPGRRTARIASSDEETVWADPADRQFDAYRRSKILAERAAWDFMAEHTGRTSLTTILPGAVVRAGAEPRPTLARSRSFSVCWKVVRLPIPRLGFWIVDVRDLAELHVHAMTASEAAANRFFDWPAISCGWKTSRRR